MATLTLATRYKHNGLEGSACLLVYDLTQLSGVSIGDDVRDILDRQPNTLRFYILAPYIEREQLDNAILDGSALKRAGAIRNQLTVEIFSLEMHKEGARFSVNCAQFFLNRTELLEKSEFRPAKGDATPLSSEIMNGWLFHLFDSSKCLVDAPVGVHFAKASSSHSTKFLRTSNALLSTAACGTLAFFSLAAVAGQEPRRIFVDTAPLLSVALAMQRIAVIHGIWEQMPPAKSFSSYGGISEIKTFSKSDLILISASTSGGLANRLIHLHVNEEMLLTLYLLKSAADMETRGQILCDLTVNSGRMFGYSFIKNYQTGNCDLCKKGYVIADLEGDQFLLEKRATKRLRVGNKSQIGTARKDFEQVARTNSISIHFYELSDSKTNIEINSNLLFQTTDYLNRFLYQIRRYAPPILDFVVAVGMSSAEAKLYCKKAGFKLSALNAMKIVTDAELAQLPQKPAANVLVLIAYLSDHARIRGINVQLRSKINGGCATYISAITIADSARNLEDLRIFLSYGEHGPETFTFRSSLAIMLPWLDSNSTSWRQELDLWDRLNDSDELPSEFRSRLTLLKTTSSSAAQLFLPGSTGELKIAPDFVMLDTKNRIENISQADVYAVVNNAIAAERSDCIPFGEKLNRAKPTPIWGQIIYHQTVLCPSNFRDFNDAILRAALIRSANIQELNYTVDEASSEEMRDVIQADIHAWEFGRGDALPEFLLSLACKRLRLMPKHVENIQSAICKSTLPLHLKLLSSKIDESELSVR
jgi:hypothetical protein